MTDRNYTCVASAMQSSKKKPVQVGDTFTTNQGCKIKVIYYNNADDITIEFDDEHRYQTKVTACNLRRGSVRNPYFKSVYGVGFIGVGKFKIKKDGVKTIEYRVWSGMLKRCYSHKCQEKRPTYKDCIVCNEWHNFQVFAEWYVNQTHYGKGYELEKDWLVNNNKIYSAETCVLAPSEINNILVGSKASKNEYPLGVSFCSRFKRFKAAVSLNNKSTHLGYFDTPEQASQAYQKAKKEYVKQKALEWQNRIDERLFNALMAKAS